MSTAFYEAPAAESSRSASSKPTQRLLSLDALRGFDMFWIIGGDGLVHALAKVWPVQPLLVANEQMDHVAWEGLRFYDLIFPTFVFVVGVSLVFSLGKLASARGPGVAIRKIFLRSLFLYILGLLYYGGISQGVDHLRLLGVLQRIALSYLFAGVLFTLLRPRWLAVICAAILIGYWALLVFVPVPGVGHGSFAEGRNLANWIDANYLPFHKWDGDHDPEGILSTLPAIATCLLGVFAGLLLKAARPAPWQKAVLLFVCGVAAVALGFYWGNQIPSAPVPDPYRCPIIKKLWTSSYVLAAGGFGAIALAIFYFIIDVINFRVWSAPFAWIGANAILLYLLERFLNYQKLAELFVQDSYKTEAANNLRELVVSVIAIAIMLSIARFFHKRQIFIRV